MDINKDDLLGRKRRGRDEQILKDFVDHPSRNRSFTIPTPYGQIVFIFKLDEQKKSFEKMAKMYISKLNGLPGTLDDMRGSFILPEDAKILEMEIEFLSAAEKDEVEKMAYQALKHFNANIVGMFREILQRFIEECFALSIIRTAGEGYHILKVNESKFFTHFIKLVNKAMKERMRIKDLRGSKSKWTPELLLDLLANYYELRDYIKEARKHYKQSVESDLANIRNKNTRRVKMADRMKMSFYDLGENVFEAFEYDLETDSYLAIQMLKENFGLNITDKSVERLLVDARKIKEQLGEKQN